MLKLKADLPDLYAVLTELKIDASAWKRRDTGYNSLALAFDNPSAAVMWHCQSRFNKISGCLA
ncbi:unnamed protein product [Symbiodinium sp. CCMP2592]|nr:unnamed protein product [Symbiodinium sp. CCMP2592]